MLRHGKETRISQLWPFRCCGSCMNLPYKDTTKASLRPFSRFRSLQGLIRVLQYPYCKIKLSLRIFFQKYGKTTSAVITFSLKIHILLHKAERTSTTLLKIQKHKLHNSGFITLKVVIVQQFALFIYFIYLASPVFWQGYYKRVSHLLQSDNKLLTP